MKIKYSFEQWCLDNGHRDWLELWDYEKNTISPSEITCGSEKRFYFKCPRGLHDSELKHIYNLTHNRTSVYCIRCDSIGQWLLDNYGESGIALYWSEENGVDPFTVRKGSNKDFKFKCVVDRQHPDYSTSPNVFASRGCRCPVCSNHHIIPGVNDIATTHPWAVQHLLHPNEATTVSSGSKREIWFKCPLCGFEYQRPMHKAIQFQCSCTKCGDGSSYPNKFVHEFLSQLQQLRGFRFETEKVFDWSTNVSDDIKRRVYDFAIVKPDTIVVEVHGEQHYKDTMYAWGGARTFAEEQENDLLKYNLAIANNVKPENYVIVDARKSDMHWIKNSIMNSTLPFIFGFYEYDINWEKCHEFACSNLVKLACDLWNSGLRNTRLIGERLHRKSTAIRTYLKQGTLLGWCDFDKSDLQPLSARRPIICVDNGVAFDSIVTCSEYSEAVFGHHIRSGSIRDNVYDYRSSVYGLHFSFITKEEFLDIQSKTPKLAYGQVYFYTPISI